MRNLIKLLFLILIIKLSTQSSVHDDLVITWEQKLKLDKFKSIMEPHLTHDYMKSEIYLIPWLKVQKFDIQSAVRFLKENLSWRATNDMDTILHEDWTDYNTEYRFSVEGCDEEGIPLASLFVGEWDMRKAILAGQENKMKRYIDKLFEEASTIIRNMQTVGSNITRVSIILECSSFSVQLQLCPRCVGFYIYLLNSLDQHYPEMVHSVIVINAPELIVTFWENILKPLTSPRLSELITIYGRNKEQWRNALLIKHSIDFSKLGPDMGGDGSEAKDFNEFRKNGYKFRCPR